jgi:hypothetical protein
VRSVRLAAAILVLLATAGTAAPCASADFGVAPGSFESSILNAAGMVTTQAGEHPAKVVTSFALNTHPSPPGTLEEGLLVPDGGRIRTSHVELPPGLIGNPWATPQCEPADFAEGAPEAICPDEAQIGIAHTTMNFGGHTTAIDTPIYNLEPPVGRPALFAFWSFVVPVYLFPTIRSNGDYGLTISSVNIDESATITATKVDLWGNPASPSHDSERGGIKSLCGEGTKPKPCPSGAQEQAFLTNSTDCSRGPLMTGLRIESWFGATDGAASVSRDAAGNQAGVTRCDRVPFHPAVEALPADDSTSTPTGLDLDLRMPNDGLLTPGAIAESPIRKAVVRLPEGMTLNPSSVDGLGTCSPAEYAREEVETGFGEGCPRASRLGSVSIATPLLDAPLEGSLYLAQPDDPATPTPGAENPFDSFLSMYLVARLPERGIVIKLPGEIEPDPRTGQIATTFDNLPQLPLSDLEMHFKGGDRAPLAMPARCGRYTTVAELTPWSAANSTDVMTVMSEFAVTRAAGGRPCPGDGSFRPGFVGGSVGNVAGTFAPFDLRLTREDGEPGLTGLRVALPPGVLARLRGVGRCPDAAVAAATTKTGKQELAIPSCPASSAIGATDAGVGVGFRPTYVPGHLYLGGPYQGAPLSLVAVTPAVVGSFDLGTVVVRQALRVDPITAQATADGSAGASIPRILRGIELNLRDLRVRLDRPSFTTTPTRCEPTRVAATVFGSGPDPFDSTDDVAADLETRYQVAGCPSLGFEPRLSLRFSGPTHRSAHPALRVALKTRGGDANVARAVVTLPKTEFLENIHIKAVCSRAEYAADRCPAGSIYGSAKAWSPLLDEPLQGRIFLRGSSNRLPDLVASLDGQIHLDLVGRIDSVHSQMRATFAPLPDAPVSRFVLQMEGGRKGLLVNNTELCKERPRASASLTGQNGKVKTSHPRIRVGCGTSGR